MPPSAIETSEAHNFDLEKIAYVPKLTGLRKAFEIPLVQATPDNLKGFGLIVASPENFPIEIVRWPAQGWRPVDDNSGDQGGTTEGIFEIWWKGDNCLARNNAVGDSYHFGWSQWPDEAANESSKPRDRILIWHANYHPDGGQMFYPLNRESFVIPLALPGDDIKPEHFTAFRVDGGKGLYIHPNIWHGSVVPIEDQCRLLDRQGRVHARVSVLFAEEFGGYLSVPLNPSKS